VRKGLAGLQQTFSKQKTTIEKLLLEIALLKRQVKSLEDEHNKSIQASIGYLQQRVASMEDAQHVAGESAIVRLQTRLEAAEVELRGTAKLANLPAWIQDGPQIRGRYGAVSRSPSCIDRFARRRIARACGADCGRILARAADAG
jgi:hypothetical protein